MSAFRGLHSAFPCARVPFWAPGFDPHPFGAKQESGNVLSGAQVLRE